MGKIAPDALKLKLRLGDRFDRLDILCEQPVVLSGDDRVSHGGFGGTRSRCSGTNAVVFDSVRMGSLALGEREATPNIA
jgi:arginase family enzyme